MKVALGGVAQLFTGVTAEVKVSSGIDGAAAPFLMKDGGDVGGVCAAHLDVERVVRLLVCGVDGSIHVHSSAERFAIERFNLRFRTRNGERRAGIVNSEVCELQCAY